MRDPALETLFLPVLNGAVETGALTKVLFMRARATRLAKEMACERLLCEQSFAPDRDILETQGLETVAQTQETGFDLVLLLPPRQRLEARAQLALACSRVAPGGMVVAAAPNTEGAKTLEADFRALAGGGEYLSKNKCRVVWGKVEPVSLNRDLLDEWLVLDAPRPVLEGAYVSRPGIFAWDRIDAASRLLADHLPTTLTGRGADLGAGFGFLTRHVLENAPAVTGMDYYEAEKRALDLARQNLAAFSETKNLNGIWTDVCDGIEGPYDFIVSNPPFHQSGRADRADIGQGFIRSAARGLRKGGAFYMVANRHLPYESTLTEMFGSFDMLADSGGYKVIRACKTKGR